MKLRNLENISIEQIVSCLNLCFKDYYTQVPSEVKYWEDRFNYARVNKSHSWGIFKNNILVGFIINAIDLEEGHLTAFNTGTGILPQFRGNHFVDEMYEFSFPALKKLGVSRCTLEVIVKNEKAIHVYERIGFSINHKLLCYEGILRSKGKAKIERSTIDKIESPSTYKSYSWDNKIKTIKLADKVYHTYEVYLTRKSRSIGYFIINPKNGYIAQLESYNGDWDAIFNGISQIHTKIKINNINERREDLILQLKKIGIDNTINQYQMEKLI